jgi:hypothetical protein
VARVRGRKGASVSVLCHLVRQGLGGARPGEDSDDAGSEQEQHSRRGKAGAVSWEDRPDAGTRLG